MDKQSNQHHTIPTIKALEPVSVKDEGVWFMLWRRLSFLVGAALMAAGGAAFYEPEIGLADPLLFWAGGVFAWLTAEGLSNRLQRLQTMKDITAITDGAALDMVRYGQAAAELKKAEQAGEVRRCEIVSAERTSHNRSLWDVTVDDGENRYSLAVFGDKLGRVPEPGDALYVVAPRFLSLVRTDKGEA